MLGGGGPAGHRLAAVRCADERVLDRVAGGLRDLDAEHGVAQQQREDLLPGGPEVAGQLSTHLVLNQGHRLSRDQAFRADAQHGLQIGLCRGGTQHVPKGLPRPHGPPAGELERVVDELIRAGTQEGHVAVPVLGRPAQ